MSCLDAAPCDAGKIAQLYLKSILDNDFDKYFELDHFSFVDYEIAKKSGPSFDQRKRMEEAKANSRDIFNKNFKKLRNEIKSGTPIKILEINQLKEPPPSGA